MSEMTCINKAWFELRKISEIVACCFYFFVQYKFKSLHLLTVTIQLLGQLPLLTWCRAIRILCFIICIAKQLQSSCYAVLAKWTCQGQCGCKHAWQVRESYVITISHYSPQPAAIFQSPWRYLLQLFHLMHFALSAHFCDDNLSRGKQRK